MNIEEALARAATTIVSEGLADEVMALAPMFDALAVVPPSGEVEADLRTRLAAALGDDASLALTSGADVREIARRGERLLAMVVAIDVLGPR